ncbi:MAG TPA: mechanosensitive ion channel [Clostridiales bacterium]|nr:mechanosensitive ion channel [Clostridiales bacterium]
MNFFNKIFTYYGLNNNTAIKYLSIIALSIVVLLICLLAYGIGKMITNKIIPRYIKKSKNKFDDILLSNKFYSRLSHVLPIIIVYLVEPLYGEYSETVEKIAHAYLIIVVVLLLVSLLDSVDELYKAYEISKTKPITAILQVVKVIVYIVTGIILVANLMGENPLALLGGLGALSAVFSLVFKDPILGFVGGIQLTSTDILRVGDWIYVQKYNAEGTVIEIALTTISLEAFDKTTVTVPNYSLITDSFVNYRGMQDSGGRRIKRSFYIDMNSIMFCTEEMLEEFKKIDIIKDYIIQKEKEIFEYNIKLGVESGDRINGRRLTNIGVFRVYLQKYLEGHSKIRNDMTLMVRQLEPIENGVPIEIYVFTNTTNWIEYESIQSDVFDHVLSVAGEFNIRLYQRPSGYDIKTSQII